MSQQNRDQSSDSGSPATSGFSSQSQMGLPEVLQMCCLSRRSGQITLRSGESYGYVYIQQGRVLHAMCGNLEGEEAIYAMLTWPGGGFSLDEHIIPHKKTIQLTWEQLLFEGAHRADRGMVAPRMPDGGPILTPEPNTTRAQDGQPKLTVNRPDLPPIVHELCDEYTHVGRAAGNEICLPYPSVSNRHTIFILSGPDVVVRDLNSSNGTYVNGETITETVLRPGDLIQIGAVEMKFEPGIKRPKLLAPEITPPSKEDGFLRQVGTTGALSYQTLRIPALKVRENKGGGKVVDDSAFVKGESAIAYNNLEKPPEEKKSRTGLIVGIVVVLLLIAAAAYYYFALSGLSLPK